MRFYAALEPGLYNGRHNYLVTAATTSPSGAQAHKVVMRPWRPAADGRALPPALAERHADAVSTHGEGCCLYTAELWLPPDSELGTWHTYLMAQTVNDVPEGTEPEAAARVIGGLPSPTTSCPTGAPPTSSTARPAT